MYLGEGKSVKKSKEIVDEVQEYGLLRFWGRVG